MTPPFGKCVWGCGRRDFNREHIIGQQIAKLLGTTFPLKTLYGRYELKGTNKVEVALDNRVCKGCNNGWMRKLDNRMVSFMRDAFSQESPVELTTKRQQTLAYWAVKVALLNELFLHDLSLKYGLEGTGPFFVPDDNLTAVRKHNKAPELTRVWIGARDERIPEYILHAAPIYLPEEQPRAESIVEDGQYLGPHGYTGLFAIGRFVVVVRGWELAYGGNLEGLGVPHVAPDSLVSIWPATDQAVEWPPARHLSIDDLGTITGTPPDWGQPQSGSVSVPEQD